MSPADAKQSTGNHDPEQADHWELTGMASAIPALFTDSRKKYCSMKKTTHYKKWLYGREVLKQKQEGESLSAAGTCIIHA